MGVVVAGALAATLAPPAAAAGDAFVRALAEDWRWREIGDAQARGEIEHVAPIGTDELVALTKSGLVRFDGLSWTDVPGWERPAGVGCSGLVELGGGVLVLGFDELTLVGPEGLRWSIRRPADVVREACAARAPDGTVLLPAGRTLLGITPEGNVWRNAGPGPVVTSLHFEGGELWCATATGVYRRTDAGFEALSAAGEPVVPLRVVGGSGRVFFLPDPGGPEHRALAFDGTALATLPLTHGHPAEAVSGVVLPDGSLLAALGTLGLRAFGESGWSDLRPGLLGSEEVRSLLLLPSSRLIALSVNGRLLACDLGSQRWEQHDPGAVSLRRNVNALAPSRRGGLWIGAGDGVARFDGERFVDVWTEADGLPLDGVTAVYEDPEGTLWVGSGSRFRGAFSFDGERWTRHVEPEGIDEQFVHAIRAGPRGEPWFLLLGDHTDPRRLGGIVARTADGWQQHYFGLVPGAHAWDRRSYDLLFDTQGRAVHATYSRIWRRGSEWEQLGDETVTPAFALHERPDGELWVGHGVNVPGIHVLVDGRWQPHPAAELADVGAADFVEPGIVDDGRLWFSSTFGLFAWDGEVLARPSDEPGVPARHFWPLLSDGNGGLWLGSLGGGLVHHTPDDREPPLLETSLARDAATGLWRVEWSGRDRWDATPAELVRYRVRIDGSAWLAPTGDTRIVLGDLAFGTHEVEVQAIDLAGNQSPVHSVEVRVFPFFWRDTEARVLTLGSLLSVCALIGLVLWRNYERRELGRTTRAAIAVSEQHYRSLVNRCDMVLACYDAEGELEYISPHVQVLTGRSPTTFLIDPGLEVQCVPRADRALLAEFAAARHAGERRTLAAEHRLQHVDQSLRWVYRKQTPRLDAQGALLGWDALMYEITERKLLEEAVKSSEERFRGIVETCHDGVWMLDPEYCTRYANARMGAILGRADADLVGRPISEFLDAENLAVVREAFERSRSGSPAQCQVRLEAGGGRRPWVILGASCIHAPAGGEVALLAMVADITDHKTAEEALQRSQRIESLGVLARGVAHDFNNLLTVVQGNCELALRHGDGDGAQAGIGQYLRRIERASSHAAELCLQMLTYAGRATIEARPVDLAELVRGMARLLEASVARRVLVETDVASEPQWVQGDPTQLRQVVMNLVLNGSEAIGDAVGQVTVSVRAVAPVTGVVGARALGEVQLEVADTGRGMDEETQRRACEPFFTTSPRGRGLGLAAVLGIVRAHGGTLAVESALGQGSRLRVSLPTSPPPAAGPQPAAPAKAAVEATNGWRGSGLVLLVDEEPFVSAVEEQELRALGFDVVVARSASEAVSRLEQHGAALRAVILDVVQPASGAHILDALARRCPDVPVLVVASAEGPAVEDAGTALRSVLQEPFRITELAEKLRALLG